MVQRRVFFSFHYERDAWRAAQVWNMGVVEGNRPVTPQQWEEIKRGGQAAIKRWIDEQMATRSCVVVLIGSETAGRGWIEYEIKKAWADRKGVLGIYIHRLKDRDRRQDRKGENPFVRFPFGDGTFANIVKAYDSQYAESDQVYADISRNIATWIEEAIEIRKGYQ